jgi:outer membrane protein
MRLLKTMIVFGGLALVGTGMAAAQTPAATPPASQTPPPDQEPDQRPAPPASQTAPTATPKPFPEGAKIAYVSLQYIASNSVEGKAATAKIQEFTKKKQAELADKQKALEALRNKLLQGGTVMSDQARNQMEKDIEKMNRELQYAQQDAQAEQTQLTNELQQDFQTRLNPVIDAVAQEKGLHMVVSIDDSGAVWVNTGLNLSAEVMKRLDAAVKTAPAPPKK